MNRSGLLLVLCAALATGCASHLSVHTEVYAGNDIITPGSFPARAAQRARSIRQAVDALDASVVMPATEDFIRALGVIKQTVPSAIAGTPNDFRPSYLKGIRSRVLQPLQPEIDRVRANAAAVESQGLAGADAVELRGRLVALQEELQRLVDGIQARLSSTMKAEEQTYLRVLRRDAAAMTDAQLRDATGLAVTNGGRDAAVDFLARRVQLATVDVRDALGRALLAPVEAAKTATAETLILPLGDPNVPSSSEALRRAGSSS